MQEIVKRYFERGFLLTPEALDFIGKNKENYDIAAKDFIIDARSFILNDEIRIIKNFQEKKGEITTEDFVKFYTSKYEKMKNIITSRIQKDFISLNKLDSMRSEAYIIGIVREIKDDNGKKILDIEDMTTSIPVIFSAEEVQDVEVDDVIAIHAVTGGKVLFGKKVIFPDIPIRQPAKGNGKGCFVSDLHFDEAPDKDIEKFFSWLERSDIKNIFVAGDIGDKNVLETFAARNTGKRFFVIPGNKEGRDYPQIPLEVSAKNITSLSNPSLIEINGIKILMVHSASVLMLKKRYLGKPKTIAPDDYLVMDEVPDVLHCGHSHQAQIINYKS
ncbi:MAG: metallophosphoesterase family protein, partial [Candidatus Aenigmarchaeota archaeon]|nr:metallophosphoesterase family protein [Candidatus Aenigmarchaeota archaeon]